jgi:hypothetical protein
MGEIRRDGVKRASRLGFPRDSASFPVSLSLSLSLSRPLSLDHRSFSDCRSGGKKRRLRGARTTALRVAGLVRSSRASSLV